MASQIFSGHLYDDAGAAIVGATVNLYDVGTVTPVRATTSTDANGYWTISHATEGRFDVEIVNGTSKRRRKYADEIQVKTIEVADFNIRNPADTFDYQIVPAAITADRQATLPLLTATGVLAVIATGSYTGDNSASRPITHGLGIVPKAVFIHMNSGDIYFRTFGAQTLLTFMSPSAAGAYTVVVLGATTFTVGNAGSYLNSANANATVYYWVALG